MVTLGKRGRPEVGRSPIANTLRAGPPTERGEGWGARRVGSGAVKSDPGSAPEPPVRGDALALCGTSRTAAPARGSGRGRRGGGETGGGGRPPAEAQSPGCRPRADGAAERAVRSGRGGFRKHGPSPAREAEAGLSRGEDGHGHADSRPARGRAEMTGLLKQILISPESKRQGSGGRSREMATGLRQERNRRHGFVLADAGASHGYSHANSPSDPAPGEPTGDPRATAPAASPMLLRGRRGAAASVPIPAAGPPAPRR